MGAVDQGQKQEMQAPVRIEKMVHGGWGLGRLAAGKVALVEAALPGEEVRIHVLQDRGGHVEAAISELVRAAPERVQAPCPYYADCGGCNLQHASYGAQLRMKTTIVAESLGRAGIVIPPEIVAPALASPQQFAYRHRLRLHLQADGQLGFHRRRSNDIVPVKACLLATDGINAALEKLNAAAPLAGLARQVKALEFNECPTSGRIFLVVYARGPMNADGREQISGALAPLAKVAAYVCTAQGQCMYPQGTAKNQVFLRQQFRHSGLNYELCWPPASFFQVNCRQNEQLVAMAMQAADLPINRSKNKSALDLFCGAGNFSLALALLGAEVLGIEQNEGSIRWARNNSKKSGLKTTRYISADAARELSRLQRENARFDTILLDPPRQGLGKAAALLPAFKPLRIISVSCDPATHARDLRLMLAGGYRLIRVQPVDLFPQTHHIETMAVLERDPAGR